MTNAEKQQIVETVTERLLKAAKFTCAPLCRVPCKVPIFGFPSVMCAIITQEGAHLVYSEQYVSDTYSPLDPQNGFIRRAFIIDKSCETIIPLNTSDFLITPDDAKDNKHWRSLNDVKHSIVADVLEAAINDSAFSALDEVSEEVKKAAEYSARCAMYGMPADWTIPKNILPHEITNDLVLKYIGKTIDADYLKRLLCVSVQTERLLKSFALERKKILANPTYFPEWDYRLAKNLPDQCSFLEVKFTNPQDTIAVAASAWEIKKLAVTGEYGTLFSNAAAENLVQKGFAINGEAALRLEEILSVSANGNVLYRKDDVND